MLKKTLSFIFCVALSCSASAQQELIFGALVKPYLSTQERADRELAYKKLIVMLEKNTHLPIKFKSFDSNDKLLSELRNHQIQLAYCCGKCIENRMPIRDQTPPLAVVLVKKNGRKVDHYDSYIISKKPGLTTLASLKNKVFGFNDKGSLSGYVYPMYYFKKNHIDTHTYFSKIKHYHGVLDGFRALDNGDVDAISVWNDAYDVNSKNKKYHTIATLRDIPNPSIVSGSNVSAQDRRILKNALLSLPASAFKGLSFVGVEAYHPNFYDKKTRIIRSIEAD